MRNRTSSMKRPFWVKAGRSLDRESALTLGESEVVAMIIPPGNHDIIII
jgi:hypothetical protein